MRQKEDGKERKTMEEGELRHQAIGMFRRADSMLGRYMDRMVRNTGVYPTQHRLLMILNREPSCSQVDLAEKFDVSPAAIAVSLKKLERGGYITRVADRSDNRINQVNITEKGKDIIQKSIRIFEEADRCFFQDFTKEEVECFLRLMERVYRNMEKENCRPDRENAH